MKDVGVVGLPGAGTSTVFTALTAMPGASPGKANQAVVPVPDPRVDALAGIESSKKLVYTQLRFIETAGAVRRGARGGAGALSAELIGHLRTADALLLVARGFGDDADPAGDLDALTLELVYADLEPVAAKVKRDGKVARSPDEKRALEALERAAEALEAGTPLRAQAWSEEDRLVFSGLGLLTLKPVVAVAGVEEEGSAPDGMIAVPAALEAEVAGMPDGEAAELLSSYGITERALPRVIRAIYEQLDLITFLTAGEKEARAWEVRRGATAPQAAGVIHSDFERGFIRADVIAFDSLMAAGSWKAAREQGTVRQEGKAYVVAEGDVVEFRFAV